MKYEGKTLLDVTHKFAYPLTSNRLSMVLWRKVTKKRLQRGAKYVRAAMDLLYLLHK